ncbi:MAG: MoaD/ThiS family protein [Chloroflexi bacterium]|nr:MoaD/ThiS family protein [Chloroflexota bacterium]
MKLHLGGNLPFFAPKRQKELKVHLQKPTRLSEVLLQLGIPVSEVYLTVLNGEQVILNETLVSDSDEVRLYPPIDGG